MVGWFRRFSVLVLVVGMLLLTGGATKGKGSKGTSLAQAGRAEADRQALNPPKVNAPYFDGDVRFSETAVFWFGHLSPSENWADVRVGYNDTELYVHVMVFDRRLWYDGSPSPEDLLAWDAVTLYLDMDGNTGSAPDASAYRFDGQLVWWEPREAYQAAYRGNGSDWSPMALSFSTWSGWRGNVPNDGVDDRGWGLGFLIPFESLGLAGPPSRGSIWGVALSVHDRDDAEGPPLADTLWPTGMEPAHSATWAALSFGLPEYNPPPAVSVDTLVVRHGLDGAEVIDGAVGGGTNCGDGLDYWSEWPETNYGGEDRVNIQNQADVADWPCFSRYYVTFPVDRLPPDAVVISATLTLHLIGSTGEGWDPGPRPSLIQVLALSEGWEENTLAWNNAPLAQENVSATWVDPVESFPGWPGIPWNWDVSLAVAEAHDTGTPLRLALYEADEAYHSGKYFVASDMGDWNEVARPTLAISWGRPVASLERNAVPTFGSQGDSIAYSLSFFGTGSPLVLMDSLPWGVGDPVDLQIEGSSVPVIYDEVNRQVTWNGTPPAGQRISIGYRAAISTADTLALVSVAELRDGSGEVMVSTTTVIANPFLAYLPISFRGK